MGANRPQQLRAVEQEQVLVRDEGDILRPLKRVQQQYIKKAEELDSKAYGDCAVAIKESANRYRESAVLLDDLIESDAAYSAHVYAVEDVRACEGLVLEALDAAVGEHDEAQA